MFKSCLKPVHLRGEAITEAAGRVEIDDSDAVRRIIIKRDDAEEDLVISFTPSRSFGF